MGSYCTVYNYRTGIDFEKNTGISCFSTLFNTMDRGEYNIREINIFLIEGIGGNLTDHNFDYSKEKVEEILELFSNVLAPYAVSIETNLLDQIGVLAQSNFEDIEYDYSKSCLKVSFNTTGLTVGHIRFLTTLVRYMYEEPYKTVLEQMLTWKKIPELSTIPPIELLQYAHTDSYYEMGHCLLNINRDSHKYFTTVISEEQVLNALKNKDISYINIGNHCIFGKDKFTEDSFNNVEKYLTYLKEKFK